MKIAIAQTQSQKGDIPSNIEKHIRFAVFAAEHGADRRAGESQLGEACRRVRGEAPGRVRVDPPRLAA